MPVRIRPTGIRWDASTVCQLKCPSCPTGQGKTLDFLKAGFLSFEDFKRVVDQNPWISYIELSSYGEVFLNPDIRKIIEYGYKKGILLSAANGSNINTLSDDLAQALVKHRFFYISCSLDGASEEVYGIYRKGGSFSNAIENIKKINHYKSRYHCLFPLLRWQFVRFGHNEHEIDRARKMARDLNMSFDLKLNFDPDYSPVCGSADKHERGRKGRPVYLNKMICGQLFNRPQINWDGRILGCCVNFWGGFGDIKKEGVLAGINNEKMRAARLMLTGRISARDDIPCCACHFYRYIYDHKDWLDLGDIFWPALLVKEFALRVFRGRSKSALLSFLNLFGYRRSGIFAGFF